jgi:hypothetical protein
VTSDSRCLSCHSVNIASDRRMFAEEGSANNFSLRQGVSCDGCHGPAEHWIVRHAGAPLGDPKWRSLSPEEKEEKYGLFNVRDPVKKAQMCMSCHVGSPDEGKVVTHAMMAAGHPPLPSFELAAYCQKLPPHWYDLKKTPYLQKATPAVQEKYHFGSADFEQTRLALATAVIGARTYADLLANRARFDGAGPEGTAAWPPPWLHLANFGTPDSRWPELPTNKAFGLAGDNPAAQWSQIAMAQSDCYACHHELKSSSWRQRRGYDGGKPGRPPALAWPFALAGLTEPGEFPARYRDLRAALDAQPFGEPTAIAKAAVGLSQWTQKVPALAADIDRKTALAMLHRLCAGSENQLPDFESARQIAQAFKAIYGDVIGDEPMPARVQEIITSLDKELCLVPNVALRSKFNEERKALLKKNEEQLTYSRTLQEIADQEMAEYLACVAGYDPTSFQTRLKELAGLLPRE